MNKLSWQYIYDLFVQAAEDVPSWAPEWVKKHPQFEKYKSLEDIPKAFPIKYYRENLDADNKIINKLGLIVHTNRHNKIYQVINSVIPLLEFAMRWSGNIRDKLSRIPMDIKFLEKEISSKENGMKSLKNFISLQEEAELLLNNSEFFSELSESDKAKINTAIAIFSNKNSENKAALAESIKRNKRLNDLFEKEINTNKQLLSEKNKLLGNLSSINDIDDYAYNTKIFSDGLVEIVSELSYENENIFSLYIENLGKNIYQMSKCFVLPKTIKMEFKVPSKEGGTKIKKIQFPTGTSLITICSTISKIPSTIFSEIPITTDSKVFEQLSNISNIPDIKEAFDYLSTKSIEDEKNLSDPQASYEIVFSAKASDVLTMSTRSVWTSCQNFLNEENARYSHHVISSSISKYVAIIYATNNKDFRKRGEQMLARSAVFLLQQKNTGKPVIYIESPYSGTGTQEYFYDKFIKSLRKNFGSDHGIPIEWGAPPKDCFFPYTLEEGHPYFDSDVVKREV